MTLHHICSGSEVLELQLPAVEDLQAIGFQELPWMPSFHYFLRSYCSRQLWIWLVHHLPYHCLESVQFVFGPSLVGSPRIYRLTKPRFCVSEVSLPLRHEAVSWAASFSWELHPHGRPNTLSRLEHLEPPNFGRSFHRFHHLLDLVVKPGKWGDGCVRTCSSPSGTCRLDKWEWPTREGRATHLQEIQQKSLNKTPPTWHLA